MKKFFNEFKEFISRGSVMDMAVGIIIGSAFTAIVTALVDNIISPLLGILTGQVDFSQMVATVGGAEIKYGEFINAVISFVLVALVVFLFIKLLNSFRRKEAEVAPKYICPYCMQEVAQAATRCPYCTAEMKPVQES